MVIFEVVGLARASRTSEPPAPQAAMDGTAWLIVRHKNTVSENAIRSGDSVVWADTHKGTRHVRLSRGGMTSGPAPALRILVRILVSLMVAAEVRILVSFKMQNQGATGGSTSHAHWLHLGGGEPLPPPSPDVAGRACWRFRTTS